MHAFENVTLKSTEDIEQAFFYLMCRFAKLNEKDWELIEKLQAELRRRGR